MDPRTASIGDRVVRGYDWDYDDVDGGDGHVGTVIAVDKDRDQGDKVLMVNVAWDVGGSGKYRTGHRGKFDLLVVDVGFGRRHILALCDTCKCFPKGFRWHCKTCGSYDLCNTCYNNDVHDLNHEFGRCEVSIGTHVSVPTRSGSAGSKVQARGLCVGAKVSQGGNMGVVINIFGGKDNFERGGVRVLWEGLMEPTIHVREDTGEIDLQCAESAVYGSYYKDHLPKLGGREFLMAGDSGSVLKSADEIMSLQEGHGGWIPEMEMSLRQVGIITSVTYCGDVKLRNLFSEVKVEWDFNPEAVTMVEQIGIGDTVRVTSDVETVKMIQPGYGDRLDELAQELGQKLGTVLMVEENGYIKVFVNGHTWIFHPACLTIIREDEKTVRMDLEDMEKILIERVEQDELIMGTDGGHQDVSTINARKKHSLIFTMNVEEGNLTEVKKALDKHPTWVNLKVSTASVMHTACYEGHLEVVKYLVSREGDMELMDGQGFRPLHCAAFGNKVKVVEYLLRQGVYASATSETGLSALHIAACDGFTDCAAVLLKHGCNINIQDETGDNAIHCAIAGASKDCRNCQKLLLESAKIDLTLRNNNGYNALQLAALINKEIAVKTILKKMPQLANAKDEDGFTALHRAANQNNANIVLILLEQGKCTIDSLSNRNETPLFLAVTTGAIDAIEVLITHGANINLPNADGVTCMHVLLDLLRDTDFEIEDSLILRKINASMRDIGVPSTGAVLACYLAKNGANLDAVDANGEPAWYRVKDPKLRDCLEKSVNKTRPGFVPAAKQKAPQSLLSKLLPFQRKDPRSLKRTQTRDEEIKEVGTEVELSIHSFDIDDKSFDRPVFELPTSPLEDSDMEASSSNLGLQYLDVHQSQAKTLEHNCSACHRHLTHLIGAPCQHAQPWPGEKDTCNEPTAIDAAEPPRPDLSALRRQNSEFRSALACTVCVQHKKAVVFECGHSTCKQCADFLPDCPVCRKPAAKVFPLFL